MLREQHRVLGAPEPSEELGRSLNIREQEGDRAGRKVVRRTCGHGEVERRVLHEDRLLEPPQCGGGLEAELVSKRRTRAVVGGERVGLPARPIEREHEQTARALAQGVLADQRFQLWHHLGMTPECEVGFEPLRERTSRSSSRRPISARANDS